MDIHKIEKGWKRTEHAVYSLQVCEISRMGSTAFRKHEMVFWWYGINIYRTSIESPKLWNSETKEPRNLQTRIQRNWLLGVELLTNEPKVLHRTNMASQETCAHTSTTKNLIANLDTIGLSVQGGLSFHFGRQFKHGDFQRSVAVLFSLLPGG